MSPNQQGLKYAKCILYRGVRLTLKKKDTLSVTLNCISYFGIFTNPSARAGYDTRSIFKRGLTGLNSEFSFS